MHSLSSNPRSTASISLQPVPERAPEPAPLAVPAVAGGDEEVLVAVATTDQIRRFDFASRINLTVDMDAQVPSEWNHDLKAFINFVNTKSVAQSRYNDLVWALRAVGLHFPEIRDPQPYLCVTGLVHMDDINVVHAVLSKRTYKQRYGLFNGLCYTLSRQFGIQLAKADETTTSQTRTSATLCGTVIQDFPRDSGKSVTIGGVIEIDGSAFALTNGHVPVTRHEVSAENSEDDFVADDPIDKRDMALILDNINSSEYTSRISRTHRRESTRSPEYNLSMTEEWVLVQHGKEWSTIEIKDSKLCLPNSIYSEEDRQRYYLTTVANNPIAQNVTIVTGCDQYLCGTLSPNDSYLHLPGGELVLTWIVHLDHINGKQGFFTDDMYHR
jgi:hypothetical protein